MSESYQRRALGRTAFGHIPFTNIPTSLHKRSNKINFIEVLFLKDNSGKLLSNESLKNPN